VLKRLRKSKEPVAIGVGLELEDVMVATDSLIAEDEA